MSDKTIAIIQPSFIPWRGYFDIIRQCDVFVFFDDVQYDKRSWRNRNEIKTADGKQWITVPVQTKGKFLQKINETKICHETNWKKEILDSIYFAYKKAQFFDTYYNWFSEELNKPWEYISELDMHLTREISKKLGIQTEYIIASTLKIPEKYKNIERILEICKTLKATKYVSGPSARAYITNDAMFKQFGITLQYQQYNYPEYPQLYGKFEPNVSIVDLLFNAGEKSSEFIV